MQVAEKRKFFEFLSKEKYFLREQNAWLLSTRFVSLGRFHRFQVYFYLLFCHCNMASFVSLPWTHLGLSGHLHSLEPLRTSLMMLQKEAGSSYSWISAHLKVSYSKTIQQEPMFRQAFTFPYCFSCFSSSFYMPTCVACLGLGKVHPIMLSRKKAPLGILILE